MTLTVFLAVLAAALMHASWNALIKIRLDRFASISIATLGMALSALPFLPFVDFPSSQVWPWIIASVIIHILYRLTLIKAYDIGDMAQIYPLARGTAPLMIAIGGIILLDEIPSGLAFSGILVLSLGTLLMSLRGGIGQLDQQATVFALMTSVSIAAYTLVDGTGARLATTAASYAAWLFFCDGLCAFAIALLYRGQSLLIVLSNEWRAGLLTGSLSAAAYGIAMWAMTKAPIASVAALRETSILFAMLISVFILGERATLWRVGAAVFIFAGVIALRFG